MILLKDCKQSIIQISDPLEPELQSIFPVVKIAESSKQLAQ